MILFNYEFDQTGIWIHKEESSTHYDNPKNAAEVCYLLLTGINVMLDGKDPFIPANPSGNQTDLLHIAKTFKRNESDSLFASIFFEEVHLFFYINGLLGGIDE